jgi:hypothetical protein
MKFRRGMKHSRITPDAVEAFKAGDEAALSAALGLKPWEYPSPLSVSEHCPYPLSTSAADWWPECLRLRAELENAAAP